MAEIESQNVGENYKLIYKELSELGRQIDASSSKCHMISDLFASEILAMRYKFREACETLLCGSPQFYGRVVREKLWRHAYYDVICRARRLVKDRDWDALSIAYITQHLFHGIGHLNVVLMKLEEIPEFKKAKFPFSPNGISNILADEPTLQREDEDDSSLSEPPKWLNDLLYIICINIGDLYRYLTDIYSKRDRDQAGSYFNRAKDYYSQAFVLYPDAGLATNQIGNLSVKLNGGIDTTYYMLHSMLSTIAYEGAPSNLQHHLSNCLVQFATLPGTHESKPIEVFCNSFLTQIHHFLYENVNITNFGKGIADLILNFQERLATYDPDLDERFLFRISSICVLTFWQLQAQNSPNISLAVAFATAMFSQLLTQLGLILEQHSHLERIEAQSASPSPSESPSPAPTKEENNELTTDVKENENENPNILEISCEVAALNIQNSQDTNSSSEKIEKTSITEEADGEVQEKQEKKKKNVLALRRRRRVFKNMIPTSSSDESDQELSDGSFVGSNNDGDDSADSDYGWSSDSDSNYSESEVENEDEEIQSGRHVVVKNRESSRAFGSSSSSNSRSDTSGNSGPAIISKTVYAGDPPKLEFASGKTSTQSNCSNGVGECDIDSENQNANGNAVPEKFVIGLDELKKCRSQLEPLLVAVLPFVRWLQVSPEIKDAFAANCGKDYVVGMCSMFNLLGSQNWSKRLDDIGCNVKNDWKALGRADLKTDKLFCGQLPEDRSMLGLPRYGTCVSDLKSGVNLNDNELLVTRMGRIILFGYWLLETKSFSMDFDETKQEFRYESPKNERRREREKKIRSLMDLDPGIDALTKAYRAGGNPDGRPRRGKGRDREKGERGQGRERRRRGGRRNQGHGADRSKNSESIVFIVVDLPAVLYNLKNVQKMANKRRFVVVLPRPVWKAIDDLKTTKDDGSEEARIASEWLKRCAADGHRGVRCLRDHEKMPIDCDYPKSTDAETTEFFIMMETCKYLLGHYRDEKPSSRTFFGDMRDKFRVICLSGYRGMLSPNSGKEFNPISLARLVGTFVDVVTSYPPNHGRRKWKGSKSNG